MVLQSLGMDFSPTPPAPLVVELLLPSVAGAPPEPASLVSVPARTPSLLAAPARRTAERLDEPVLVSASSHTAPDTHTVPDAMAAAPATATAAALPVGGAAQTLTSPAGPAVPALPAAPASPAATATTDAPRFDAAYLDNPSPNYPPLSRRAREQGRVVLRVFVDASGQASRVDVQTSSGFERLDRAATTAVSRWKFVPAKRGSELVAAWVLVPFVFSLKD
jgi:protein TonB